MIAGICDEDRVVARDQALRMIETRGVCGAIGETGLAAAETAQILAGIVEQRDLVVPRVRKRPAR